MLTIENRVGKLTEIRFVHPVTRAELEQFALARRTINARLGKDRVVCTDLRRADVLTPELSDLFLGSVNNKGSALTRNGVLVPADRAVLALQIERFIREGKNPARRSFGDRAALESWLGEVLDADERARLGAFLDEGVDRAASTGG